MTLQAPPLDKFTPVVDRLRNLCKGAGAAAAHCPLQLEMDGRGFMSTDVRSDIVLAKTYFRNLKSSGVPDSSGASGSGAASATPSPTGAVSVDARVLSRALHALSMDLRRVIVGICPATALVLHAELADSAGSVTLLLSCVSSGDEDMPRGGAAGGPTPLTLEAPVTTSCP